MPSIHAKARPTAQASLDSLPTETPAPYLVWETKTVKYDRSTDSETWQFYQTTCKGHTFKVGLVPREFHVQWPTKPPSQWDQFHWELLAEFEPGGDLEFMSSLFAAKNKEEALQLAEQRIRGFLQQKRTHYA